MYSKVSETNRMRSMVLELASLASVVAVGAALRTYMWFNGYALSGQSGLVRHGDGYLEMAAALDAVQD